MRKMMNSVNSLKSKITSRRKEKLLQILMRILQRQNHKKTRLSQIFSEIDHCFINSILIDNADVGGESR